MGFLLRQPRFESGFPYEVPSRFTDNDWRASQNEYRTRVNTRLNASSIPDRFLGDIPDYPGEDDFDFYVRPAQDQTVSETGSGTKLDPFVLIASAKAAVSSGDKVGIASGHYIDSRVTSLAASAGAFLSLGNAEDNTTWATWFEDPDVRWPTVVRRMGLFGASAANWEEVDIKSGQAAGTTIVPGGGSGTYTLLSGSGVWHLKSPATIGVDVRGVGFGSADSITDVVDETSASFRAHGVNARHVQRKWIANGASSSVVVSSVGLEPTLDMQHDFCDNGGFICVSIDPTTGLSVNPATRWGGVWLIDTFSQVVTFAQNSNNIKWLWALQGEECGTFIRVASSTSTITDHYIEGVCTNLCAYPIRFDGGQSSTLSPVGGPTSGVIQMGLGTNAADHGDGNKPWIEDIEINYVRSKNSFSGPSFSGWWRRSRIHDIATLNSRLLGGNAFFFGECYAADDTGDRALSYAEYNEFFDIVHTNLDAAVGEFWNDDHGLDFDGGTANVHVHDFRIDNSVYGVQCSGDAYGNKVYRGEAVNCIIPFEVRGSGRNGTSECDLFHVRGKLTDPASWASSSEPGGSIFANGRVLNIAKNCGYEAKGPDVDGETRARNLGGIRVRNIIAQLGDCPAADAYGIVNETSPNTPPDDEGSWVDVGGGLAANGIAVPAAQTQETEYVDWERNTVFFVGAWIEEQKIVDEDLNDASGTETVVNVVDGDASDISGDDLAESADADARVGGVACRAVSEGSPAYVQQDASGIDMRGIPLYVRSAGGRQAIPRSSGARAF